MARKMWLGFLFCVVLLLFQYLSFDVLQDDAFISFRYVRNFLAGQELVFNVGQRVEGYTNFFWIVLLVFFSKLGLPLVGTARAAGLLAAAGTLGTGLYAARRWYPERGWIWLASVPFLLAANGSLAYWGGSGLETGLFSLLSALAALSYFSRPAFSLLFVSLATLTRPEGALLAFLFGVGGILLKQRSWRTTFAYWGGLSLLLIPFAVFKYFYYGSLLPNPFYAKTGFSLEYLESGLAYVWLFLKHYGGCGLFLLLPVLLWKRLSIFSRFSLLVFSGYTIYLILVGGDVLKAHRFFVPALFFFYLPAAEGLYLLAKERFGRAYLFAGGILLFGVLFFLLPRPYLGSTAQLERALVEKMEAMAELFAEHDYGQRFAISTIGAFSYYAESLTVIDMVGLTDRTIAENPEKIGGLVSTWKERHFNAAYVLAQKPDVIIFTTDIKPSSPGERALFLYPEFRHSYRLEFLFGSGRLFYFYRRFRDYGPVGKPDRPAAFVNLLHDGLTLTKTDRPRSIALLGEALAFQPQDCSVPYLVLGYLYSRVGLADSAEQFLQKGMALDSGGSLGRWYYATFLYKQKRYREALPRLAELLCTVPTADALMENYGILRASPQAPTAHPIETEPWSP